LPRWGSGGAKSGIGDKSGWRFGGKNFARREKYAGLVGGGEAVGRDLELCPNIVTSAYLPEVVAVGDVMAILAQPET